MFVDKISIWVDLLRSFKKDAITLIIIIIIIIITIINTLEGWYNFHLELMAFFPVISNFCPLPGSWPVYGLHRAVCVPYVQPVSCVCTENTHALLTYGITVSMATGSRPVNWEVDVRVLVKVKNSRFSESSRPALGSTQPPLQWTPRSIFPEVKQQGVWN
jgi:hypothetical protein